MSSAGSTSTGDRFVAMTPDEPALLADMLTREQLGRKVCAVRERRAQRASRLI